MIRADAIQLMWLKWDPLGGHLRPYLLFRDYSERGGFSSSRVAEISCNQHIHFIVTQKRFCVGYPDEDDNLVPCKSCNPVKQTFQCSECRNKDPLYRCVMCRGHTCWNPKALKYCKSVPHVVYLTAYAPDFVKVGTAKKSRFEIRIAEQGANVASVVCTLPKYWKIRFVPGFTLWTALARQSRQNPYRATIPCES